MIHLSAQALTVLTDTFDKGQPPAYTRACDGENEPLELICVSARQQTNGTFKFELVPAGRMPTCPKCAVLWDEALSTLAHRRTTL